MTRKLTVSAGVRWEYYPVPQHADRGVEIFDFTRNRLLLCGLGDVPIDCGIKVQKDLFTPRLGVAYRATDSLVFRAGYSRNPQNDNMIGGRMRNFPVNVQINDVAVGGNNFTPVGSFSQGYPLLPILDLTQPVLEVPAGANITTNEVGKYTRGVITSFNVSAQKVLPYNLTAQIGYVGNRQNDMVRNQNLNYSQIGGGNASLPFNQPGLAGGFRTTAQVNVVRPLGRVQYDSLQVSVNRRMTNGFAMTSAYTYAKATDWWAGGILIPEYWHLNKGHAGRQHAAQGRYFGDLRAAVRSGQEIRQRRRRAQQDRRRLAAEFLLHRFLRLAVQHLGEQRIAEREQRPAGRSGEIRRRDPRRHRRGQPVLRPDRVQAGHRSAVRHGGIQHASRTELSPTSTAACSARSAVTSAVNLQFRLEVFNVTNTPHFPNPSGTNVSNVVYNADGSIRSLNGFGSITGTNNVGREYDERYIRLGVRMSF